MENSTNEVLKDFGVQAVRKDEFDTIGLGKKEVPKILDGT
jgi:hypothetical protein